MRRALDFILRQQEPYPAIVIDRHWNILLANAAAGRLVEPVSPSAGRGRRPAPNAMRLMSTIRAASAPTS